MDRKKPRFSQFCKQLEEKGLVLSDLRKDVLLILYHRPKPTGAYDILETLKKKRDNAEPPTVYRVLKWLVEMNIIHRVESQNAYVFCSAFHDHFSSHQTILLICSACKQSIELSDASLFRSIKKFSAKHRVAIHDNLIELNGICESCLRKK